MCRNGQAGNLRRSGSSGDGCEGGPIVAVICGNLNRHARVESCSRGEQRIFHASRRCCRAQHSVNQALCRLPRFGTGISVRRGRTTMFEFGDLFQWDRFITPTIIKTFYWLVIALICLFGLSGIFSGLAMMAISPFGGFLMLLSSIASVVVGIVFSRILAELILIIF